jgi:hypothetical protein
MDWVKRATRWWSSLFFLLTFVLVTACGTNMPDEPLGQICTLVGCNGGLSVEITGVSLADGYEVNLILPSGEKINQVCGETPVNSFEKSCHESGAFFSLPADGAPPETVKIEVIVDGEIYEQEFSPVYEKFQPNGEGCPPICYNSTLVFQAAK